MLSMLFMFAKSNRITTSSSNYLASQNLQQIQHFQYQQPELYKLTNQQQIQNQQHQISQQQQIVQNNKQSLTGPIEKVLSQVPPTNPNYYSADIPSHFVSPLIAQVAQQKNGQLFRPGQDVTFTQLIPQHEIIDQTQQQQQDPSSHDPQQQPEYVQSQTLQIQPIQLQQGQYPILNVKIDNAEAQIPCEICLQLIRFSQYEEHLNSHIVDNSSNKQRKKKQMKKRSNQIENQHKYKKKSQKQSNSEVITFISCPFCEVELPAYSIEIHVENCCSDYEFGKFIYEGAKIANVNMKRKSEGLFQVDGRKKPLCPFCNKRPDENLDLHFQTAHSDHYQLLMDIFEYLYLIKQK